MTRELESIALRTLATTPAPSASQKLKFYNAKKANQEIDRLNALLAAKQTSTAATKSAEAIPTATAAAPLAKLRACHESIFGVDATQRVLRGSHDDAMSTARLSREFQVRGITVPGITGTHAVVTNARANSVYQRAVNEFFAGQSK